MRAALAFILALGLSAQALAASQQPPTITNSSNVPADIIPMAHAQRLRTEQNPVICFTGDSLMLENGTGEGGNNNVTLAQTEAGMISRKLQLDNPTKTFTFQNYAIGGTTLAQLGGNASVPTASQSWTGTPAWSGSATSWPTQLASFNCTQMYIGTGENDNTFADASALKNLLNDLAGESNPPDVFLLTSELPGPSFVAGTPPSSWVFPASMFRNTVWSGARGMLTTAGSLSLGLLDVGGWQAMNVWGQDYRNQYLTDLIPAASPQAVTWASTGTTSYGYTTQQTFNGDFYVSLTMPGQAATIFNGGASTLSLSIGTQAATSQIQLSLAGGRVYFIAYPSYGSNGISGGSTAAPTGDLTITLSAVNSRVSLTVNGIQFYNFDMPRDYYPPMAFTVAASNPGYVPTMTINQLAGGELLPMAQTMSYSRYFGEAVSGCSGGYADVHPSTCGYAVLAKYINSQNFSAAPEAPPPVNLTLAANYTVKLAGAKTLFLNPNGGAYNVILPPITASNNGLSFTIQNTGTTGTLQVQTSAAVSVGSALSTTQRISVTANNAGVWQVGP